MCLGVKSKILFFARKPALGRRWTASLLQRMWFFATERAWISDTLRPHAAATRKAVFLVRSTKWAWWSGSNGGSAKRRRALGRALVKHALNQVDGRRVRCCQSRRSPCLTSDGCSFAWKACLRVWSDEICHAVRFSVSRVWRGRWAPSFVKMRSLRRGRATTSPTRKERGLGNHGWRGHLEVIKIMSHDLELVIFSRTLGWEQSVGRQRPTSCPNWSSSHPGRMPSGHLPSCKRLGASCFDCWQTGLWGVFAGGWTAFDTQSG